MLSVYPERRNRSQRGNRARRGRRDDRAARQIAQPYRPGRTSSASDGVQAKPKPSRSGGCAPDRSSVAGCAGRPRTRPCRRTGSTRGPAGSRRAARARPSPAPSRPSIARAIDRWVCERPSSHRRTRRAGSGPARTRRRSTGPGRACGTTRRGAGRSAPCGRPGQTRPDSRTRSTNGNRPTLNRGEVVTEPRCEYTTDCLGRAGTRPFGGPNFAASCSHVSFPDQAVRCETSRTA